MTKQLELQLSNRIENWKKNLIDMSKRNTLLNFRPKRTNSVKFLNDPSTLFTLLVDDEKQLNCEKLETQYSKQIIKIQSMNIDDSEKKKRIAEENQNYRKILNKLRTAAKTRMNEQGINISYLAFGLLKWKETQSAKTSDFLYAPLLLVPASLKKASANDPFMISQFEDDIVINPFLAHMLREQHGIILPELSQESEGLNVIEFWAKVKQLILNLEDWDIEEDVYLSLFSFNKLIMYKDMETYKDLIENHALIKQITGISDEESRKQIFDHTRIPEESQMDRKVPSHELFNILDADSSQQQAILAAKNGMSFVLQGPPGTGKSQTISNIIAENLANNKKVLFVSEKMAALNVVKSRLESEGLGDFCLEMHSQKANKRQVLDELNYVLNKQMSKTKASNDVYSKINVIREKLNTYSEKIHLKREPYNKTVYEVHGMLSKLESVPELMVEFNIETGTDLESIYRILHNLERYRASVYNAKFHPWEGFNDESYSLELKSKVTIYLQQFIKLLNSIENLVLPINESTGIKINTIKNLTEAIEILEMAIHSPLPPVGWFDKNNISQLIKDAQKYQDSFLNFLDNKKQLAILVDERILDVDQLSNIFNNLFIEKEQFISLIPETNLEDILIQKEGLIGEIQDFLNVVDKFTGYKELANNLGILQLDNIVCLKQLHLYLMLLNKQVIPTIEWFEEQKFVNVKSQALIIRDNYTEISVVREKLLCKYTPDFLEINAEKVLIDFSVKENQVESFKRNQESIEFILYDQKEKIKKIFNDTFNLLKLFNTYKTDFEELFGLQIDNFSTVANIEIAVQLIEKMPRPEENWFNTHNHHNLQNAVREGRELFSKFQNEYSKAGDLFEEEIYDQRIYDMYDRCEGKYQSFLRVFNGTYKKDLKWFKGKFKVNEKINFDSFYKYVRNVKRVMEYKNQINEKETEFRSLFGWHYQAGDTNWSNIEEALSTTREIVEWHQGRNLSVSLRQLLVRPTGQSDQLKVSFMQFKKVCDEIRHNINIIQSDFPNLMDLFVGNIFVINITELFAKLQTEWSKVEEYYKFIDDFGVYLKNPLSLNVVDLKNDLKMVAAYKQKTKVLEEGFHKNLITFGGSFRGEDTAWNELLEFMNDFDLLFKNKIRVTEEFINAILKGREANNSDVTLGKYITFLEKEMSRYYNALPKMFKDFEGLESSWNFEKFGDRLNIFKVQTEDWQNEFSKISSYFLNINLSFQEIRNLLEKAVCVKTSKEKIDGDLETLQVVFGERFTGYSTNWGQIFDALSWANEWHELFSSKEMPIKLLNYVSAEGKGEKNDLKDWLNHLQEQYDKTQVFSKEFHLYFSATVIFNKGELLEINLSEFLHFVKTRLDSIDLLEDWIRYQRIEKQASELGLERFVFAIKNDNLGDFTFKDLFQKRLFKLWLDQIYKQEPLLFEFDADAMNTDVENFKKLDKNSNQLNVHRITEILEKNRNNSINSLAFRRELQTMQAEIGKKKRHYPIRKLINLTASLFMEIKPCLLMSPLSVSQFLDASVIQFDLVIFDEASQIFSEDAIGAIVRGKQVIIVGDSKQLPPTNFFHSSMIDEDYDEDQDDEQDVQYESILDECANILPPINLRWHYRSKHESLITFSNQAFYHNNLITFPSSDNGPYLGTEFVYVEDGVYDRGGTGTNKKEAEKIAYLVIDHFKEYPNQSLGVIAFSEKQASAIENELMMIRNANPLFERFFQEGAHEEFFIKSLENVQGDERDVIFLSVGYGKASDQSLHYNFGPLSKARGERRLNVAVTRAKYHMKLISSLKPSDLSDDKISNNTGMRLLKDYMQTAMDGKLPVNMTNYLNREFDSPFEEDVYNVLIDMGYRVETQVGCSGYRIDLAVVDPIDNNKFILGIECDGKSYHSSKVARDRDRLRQQVLEGLGWKIYRIWSQEWFKKRKYEVIRLKNYLESLMY